MKKTLIVGAIALTLGGVAVAQERRGPDANGDGAVSRAELTNAVEQRFARVDANRDGRITSDERRQVRADRMDKRADRRFARLDADKNGSISRAEFDAAGEKRMSRRAERGGARANADRVVTRDQFVARAIERFEANDANNDGQVTREERRAGRQERRGR